MAEQAPQTVEGRTSPMRRPCRLRQTWSGRSLPAGLCAANAKKNLNREGLGIEVDFSLPAERVIYNHALIIEWRSKPTTIRVSSH
jgi:hypothetical protein